MRWDGKNKDKIYDLLQRKFWEINERHRFLPVRERYVAVEKDFNDLMALHGIEHVQRTKALSNDNKPKPKFWARPFTRTPARSRKHIIIVSPAGLLSRPENKESGLKIPKDVAEKFLVLGVP